MKTILTTTLVSLFSLSAALAGPKEDIKAAAAKLAEAPCYSWTANTEMAGGNFTPAPVSGKSEKGGFAIVTQTRDGNTTTAVLKGEKGVVKTDDGWKTAEELQAAATGGGGGGAGGFMRGALLRTRLPADLAGRIADKTKELKAADGAISGDLTEEGAKEQLTFGRGRAGGGANPPEPKNAKGSVKYWLKDGQIAKVEVKVSGTITTRNGEERETARTTTYEISKIGTTTVEVPAEAKAKLGS